MKPLLLTLLLSSNLLFAQSVPISQVNFGTVTDLRLQAGTPYVQVNVLGISSISDNNGGLYRWDASNVTADDGFLTVKVGNVTTGRWVRVSNGNTLKGTVITSGGALQTAYNVSYSGGALPFTPSQVYIQATSANAAVPSWVTNISTTGFTVNFSSIPILGTNNLTFSYLVIKQ